MPINTLISSQRVACCVIRSVSTRLLYVLAFLLVLAIGGLADTTSDPQQSSSQEIKPTAKPSAPVVKLILESRRNGDVYGENGISAISQHLLESMRQSILDLRVSRINPSIQTEDTQYTNDTASPIQVDSVWYLVTDLNPLPSVGRTPVYLCITRLFKEKTGDTPDTTRQKIDSLEDPVGLWIGTAALPSLTENPTKDKRLPNHGLCGMLATLIVKAIVDKTTSPTISVKAAQPSAKATTANKKTKIKTPANSNTELLPSNSPQDDKQIKQLGPKGRSRFIGKFRRRVASELPQPPAMLLLARSSEGDADEPPAHLLSFFLAH